MGEHVSKLIDAVIELKMTLIVWAAVIAFIIILMISIGNYQSGIERQTHSINTAAYAMFDQKYVTGQEVLETLDSYQELGIAIGNYVKPLGSTSGNYVYRLYNTDLSIKEDEYRDLENDSDNEYTRFTAINSNYLLNDEGVEEEGTTAKGTRGSKSALVDKSHLEEFIPQYNKYFARLATFEGKVTGIIFKEVY